MNNQGIGDSLAGNAIDNTREFALVEARVHRAELGRPSLPRLDQREAVEGGLIKCCKDTAQSAIPFYSFDTCTRWRALELAFVFVVCQSRCILVIARNSDVF